MKILTKHILKEIITPFLVCTFIFTILFFLGESMQVLNLDVKTHNALSYLPLYLLYKLPFWLTQTLPVSLLLSFLFAYSNLAYTNEILAIKAGGINLKKIFFPIIMLGFVVSCLVIIANETIVTGSTTKAYKNYTKNIRGGNIEEQKIFSDINYLGKHNSKFIIKSFNSETNTMYKVNIDTFDGIILKKQIYSEFAKYKEGTIWTFKNGVIRTFYDDSNINMKEEFFNEKNINIFETPDSFKVENIKTKFITIRQLQKNIQKLEKNSLPFHKELTDMYNKIAFPFSNLIILLIGIAFATSSIKKNKVISFAISLGISFIYWGSMSIFLSLGSNNILNPFISAWATNLIFICITFFMMKKMKL